MNLSIKALMNSIIWTTNKTETFDNERISSAVVEQGLNYWWYVKCSLPK